MSSFKNKTVLVTGGAGGIGKLLGQKALQAGAGRLIIWDIDTDAMQKIKFKGKNHSHKVRTYRVDLSQFGEIYDAAELVKKEIGTVDILFNNAGIVAGKWFHEQTIPEINQTINVNALGVMHTTRAFLPAMMDQNSGHIVNISSAVSLIANPRMASYAGSKWAVTGWSESLRLEMQQLNCNVRVTTIQPGYIDTGMFAGVKPPRLTPLLEPRRISSNIIRAVQQNKIVLREPFMVKLLPFLKGIMPARMADYVAGKLFKVYHSMETYKGRSD